MGRLEQVRNQLTEEPRLIWVGDATVTVLDGIRHDSVAYIGTRPTFGAGERLLEVYLLQGNHDLYGRTITVEFVEVLRGESRLPGLHYKTIATHVERLVERHGRDAERPRGTPACAVPP